MKGARVWYADSRARRDIPVGLTEEQALELVEHRGETHVVVGTTPHGDPEQTWHDFQGENMTRADADRVAAIAGRTSMCVGDLIETERAYHVAAPAGFYRFPKALRQGPMRLTATEVRALTSDQPSPYPDAEQRHLSGALKALQRATANLEQAARELEAAARAAGATDSDVGQGRR